MRGRQGGWAVDDHLSNGLFDLGIQMAVFSEQTGLQCCQVSEDPGPVHGRGILFLLIVFRDDFLTAEAAGEKKLPKNCLKN